MRKGGAIEAALRRDELPFGPLADTRWPARDSLGRPQKNIADWARQEALSRAAGGGEEEE